MALFIAARTTAGPPVTTSRLTRGLSKSFWAVSIVGSATVHSTLAGPPARWMASFRMLTVRALTLRAAGWALKTTAFPAATMPMALLKMVSVGLVLGVMEPTTP